MPAWIWRLREAGRLQLDLRTGAPLATNSLDSEKAAQRVGQQQERVGLRNCRVAFGPPPVVRQLTAARRRRLPPSAQRNQRPDPFHPTPCPCTHWTRSNS